MLQNDRPRHGRSPHTTGTREQVHAPYIRKLNWTNATLIEAEHKARRAKRLMDSRGADRWNSKHRDGCRVSRGVEAAGPEIGVTLVPRYVQHLYDTHLALQCLRNGGLDFLDSYQVSWRTLRKDIYIVTYIRRLASQSHLFKLLSSTLPTYL